ncbi:methionine--tRNA ligase [Candidatus Methylopumilus universalis]|uniref:methionine--tRNA ligase n=1 Tax=Candidatus Methylopumilus universalis TaxID=2588536 RepID=UPI003BEF4A85
MRKLLITSALPYANGSIHLGHLVEYIQTDIWVRFQKMQGHEAYYVCADDTHGTPIMLRAEKEGVTPEELIKKVHVEHSKDFSDFFVNFDNFYSTNSPENLELSQIVYKKLKQNNKIYTKTIEQFYDPAKEMFLPDRFIKGECPKCHAKDQYGDSCEVCGATYAPTELINPTSSVSGAVPVRKETEHYFFKLSECESFLADWTSSGTLQQEAANKMKEWFKSGLADWDISRDAPYFGFEIPDAPGKYFYVWLDAPIGYMASFKKLCEDKKINFDEFWNADSKTELYHFIGKDILYFHALFWPATLEFSGYRKPTKIFAHGFLTVNAEKMSKSRGTFITARSYLDHIKNPDYLRYYYAAKLNSTMEDIDLNLDDFLSRVNSDLVGKFINIASRTSGFIHKYFEGKLFLDDSKTDQEHISVSQKCKDIENEIKTCFEAREYGRAVREIMRVADITNEYVNTKAPWTLAKDEAQHKPGSELHVICSRSLEAFRRLSIYLTPILPKLTKDIAIFFNEKEFASFKDIDKKDITVNEYQHILTRVEKKDIDMMIESNKESLDKHTEPPKKVDDNQSTILIDDFLKIDLRVALIKEASFVEGADSLLKLTLDINDGRLRQVFAGIKSKYNPDQLVGKLTVMVANLKPRQMKFGLSEGMVLAASNESEGPFVLYPDQGAKPGMRIK